MKFIITFTILVLTFNVYGQHPFYEELKKIYLSTNGDNWTDNSGWKAGMNNSNSDPCNWKGITCSAGIINGFVNNLTGTLPDEIKIPTLKWFKAQNNKITGEIPVFTGPLTQLNLSKNKITGPLPDYLSKFKNVTNGSFLFGDNDLSGCFYPWIKEFLPSTIGTYPNPKMPYLGQHINYNPNISQNWSSMQ